MEALVAIVLEFLVALIYPFCAAFFGMVAAALEGLFVLIAGILGVTLERRKTRPAEPKRDDSPEARARRAADTQAGLQRMRRVLHWIAVPSLAVFAVVAIANYAFFPSIFGYVLDRVEARSGYVIEVAEVEGDLFRGRLALTDLRVTQTDPARPPMDIRADYALVDANVFTLLSGNITVEQLDLQDVAGRILLPEKAETGARSGSRKTRTFTVEDLRLSDVDLEIELARGSVHRLQVPQAEAAPMRSNLAAFDLFFRSNLTARLDDAELHVRTAQISENGRETFWRIDGVEMELLAALVPNPPFTWMEAGTFAAVVDDRWDRSLPQTEIVMDWNISLSEARIDASRAEPGVERVVATAAAQIINRRETPYDLSFDLTLKEGDLQSGASGDLKALGRAVGEALLTAFRIPMPEQGDAEEEAEAKLTLRDRIVDAIRRD